MADLDTTPRKGQKRARQIRIDLTPMVDLGFLLITFFIYTTAIAKPRTMAINMPDNEPTDRPTAYIAESTITLIPIKGHKVVYYSGDLSQTQNARITGIDGADGIEDILLHKTSEVRNLRNNYSADAHKLHVLIKPDTSCTYSDVVDLLDEMNILKVPYYALTDITTKEDSMLRKFK